MEFFLHIFAMEGRGGGGDFLPRPMGCYLRFLLKMFLLEETEGLYLWVGGH